MPTRVLLIDDDARLVEMLGGYLRTHGYQVDCCGDGESGLQAQRRTGYDAVVLDVMLPGIDGLEVCRRMRAFSQVPIVMLTARGDDMDRIVGIEIGADDYLPKPFNPRELLARLAAVLRRTRAGERQASDQLRVGPLEIDRGAREVRVHGQRRELTGRQFDLLLLLAERAGRVQTREQLMDALKGEEWDNVDRSIDVHISRIRQAIEDDPRHPRLVQTVRGAGYVLALLPAGADVGEP
ncbi:MAG TPA: response regulator transcription factor [Polyangia bacterium]|jgi:Response regulators consisting of a CheY-like receiver domain and a winged-helix DNA-binding domain|nr:response regulator transcription factor [Polyangia bacterium]